MRLTRDDQGAPKTAARAGAPNSGSNSWGRRQALTHNLFDLGHDVVDREIGRVDDDGVSGGYQR
jgi:hypothetical protein